MSTTPFSVRLDPKIKARLEEEARIANLSASSLANKAIESFLAARAAKRSHIEAALVEAEKGDFISGDALDRWIDSWEMEAELLPPRPHAFGCGSV
jgi:RHH-type rel operon transcriptional repressor/antitoxin RelB